MQEIGGSNPPIPMWVGMQPDMFPGRYRLPADTATGRMIEPSRFLAARGPAVSSAPPGAAGPF